MTPPPKPSDPPVLAEHTPKLPLRIGAPVWACADWGGEIYPPRTPRRDWLKWYSRMFNTVEGNSTFYALPGKPTFEKWANEASTGFQFCFKVPKLISHDLQLQNAEEETSDFVSRLEILAKFGCLGPTFLQLGPRFGPDRFAVLEQYLNKLPKEFPWAVELRHFDWFDRQSGDQTDNEKRVNELLSRLNMDKVLFDSRPLFQSPPEDPIEEASQARKPKTPVRQTVTGYRPMIRIVGRNRVELADTYFRQWAPIIAKWIRAGLEPVVFTHAPNDKFAPCLARNLLATIQDEFPEFKLELPTLSSPAEQLSLFEEPS